jgi:hypothetical protein
VRLELEPALVRGHVLVLGQSLVQPAQFRKQVLVRVLVQIELEPELVRGQVLVQLELEPALVQGQVLMLLAQVLVVELELASVRWQVELELEPAQVRVQVLAQVLVRLERKLALVRGQVLMLPALVQLESAQVQVLVRGEVLMVQV